MRPDYRLISADSHIIEPPNLWLDYITPKYRERAPRLVHEPDTDVFYCEGVPLLSVGLAAAVGGLAYVLLVWAPASMTPFRLGNLGRYCPSALPPWGSAWPGVEAACSCSARACSSGSAPTPWRCT